MRWDLVLYAVLIIGLLALISYNVLPGWTG